MEISPLFGKLSNHAVSVMSIKQLTSSECRIIDQVVRDKKGSATDAFDKINEKRATKGEPILEKTCVHRYVKGLTHKPDVKETRGRKPALSKKQIRSLDLARRRLIRASNNNTRVTYYDVIKEAKLEGKVSSRVCEDALRSQGVMQANQLRRPKAILRFDLFKYLFCLRIVCWIPSSTVQQGTVLCYIAREITHW